MTFDKIFNNNSKKPALISCEFRAFNEHKRESLLQTMQISAAVIRKI